MLAAMEAPPNMGKEYTQTFRSIFTAITKLRPSVKLIPFLLIDVAGKPALNQPDGIHPTPEGHKLVAEYVWKYLQPVLATNTQ